jgi:hypothetical protein
MITNLVKNIEAQRADLAFKQRLRERIEADQHILKRLM